MAQRVRNPYRRHSPSSARQLPILAALYAGFPTLFPIMIHEIPQKVKQEFTNFSFFFCIWAFVEFDEKLSKTL